MKRNMWVVVLFIISAVYDGVLGIAFLFAGSVVFDMFGVTPPNHFGYVQFPAALLIVFAIMYIAIAKNPVGNRNLIIYGTLLKVSYCAVVFYHWIATGLPFMWKPFAIADLAFLVLYILAYVVLGKGEVKEVMPANE